MLNGTSANRIAVAMTQSGILVYASPSVVEKVGALVAVRFDTDDAGKVSVHLTSPTPQDRRVTFSNTAAGPDHTASASHAVGKRHLGSAFFGKTTCEVIAIDAGNAIAILPAPAHRSKPKDRKVKELIPSLVNGDKFLAQSSGAAVDLDAMLAAAKRHGMAYDPAKNRFIPLKTGGSGGH